MCISPMESADCFSLHGLVQAEDHPLSWTLGVPHSIQWHGLCSTSLKCVHVKSMLEIRSPSLEPALRLRQESHWTRRACLKKWERRPVFLQMSSLLYLRLALSSVSDLNILRARVIRLCLPGWLAIEVIYFYARFHWAAVAYLELAL